MCIKEKPFLKSLLGQKSKRKPIWFMRQAGRYLPEYKELRKQTDNFISFCLTPSLAAEATLQPLKRFDLDAAILFADILLIPLALGQKVHFIQGQGPRLNALSSRKDINALQWDNDLLAPVYETIKLVKKELSVEKALIGFAGSPWTVACYMIDGQGGSFLKAQKWVTYQKDDLNALIDVLVHETTQYLREQIQAGVDALQLFDSHAGLLTGDDFKAFVIKPTARICSALKKEFPDVPIIGFPRNASFADYKAYAQETGVDGLSFDHSVPVSDIQKIQPLVSCVQGNLDPQKLLNGGDAMKKDVHVIMEALPNHHIFNLGHGVIKETPPEHVSELIKLIRELEH